MTKTSKTVVFFGNERLATGVSTTAPSLRRLIAEGYQVAAVVSNYEPGQSRKTRALEVAEVAKQHKIPLLLPEKPAQIIDQLKPYRAEVGVLVAYGKIIPQAVINIFPKGIVNIHPSLLPLHRGPTPLESVILDGSSTTGVSIMSLVKQMDAGPVYQQVKVPLNGRETKQALADQLADQGSHLLAEALPGIIDGSLAATPQDNNQATYDQLISKEDGVLDFNKPAHLLAREIRAYADWPKSRTVLAGKDVVILTAHAVDSASLKAGQVISRDKQLLIGTSRGALVVDHLQPAGKKPMSAAAFLAGYQL